MKTLFLSIYVKFNCVIVFAVVVCVFGRSLAGTEVPTNSIISFMSGTTKYLVSDDVVVVQVDQTANKYIVYGVEKSSSSDGGSVYTLVLKNELSGECVEIVNSKSFSSCSASVSVPSHCPVLTITIIYTPPTDSSIIGTITVSGKFLDNSDVAVNGEEILLGKDLKTAKNLIKKYSTGSYCEIPNIPDGTVMQFFGNEIGIYTVSDDIISGQGNNEFLVYEVLSKKNSADGSSSVYTLKYNPDLSGKCDLGNMIDCNINDGSQANICTTAKLSSLTLKYVNGAVSILAPADLSDKRVTTLPPGEFLPVLDKYAAATFCETPNIPDGTIVQFFGDDWSIYLVSDDIVVNDDTANGNGFLVYEVLSKKNSADGSSSVYTLLYKPNLSGKCDSGSMIDCNVNDVSQANICIATKLTTISLKNANNKIAVVEPPDLANNEAEKMEGVGIIFELFDYSVGNHCKLPIVPEGTIVQLDTLDWSSYLVSDSIVAYSDGSGNGFVVYKVSSKECNADGNTVYTIEYKPDLSGKCDYGNMIDCNINDGSQADICAITKLTEIILRYENGEITIIGPDSLAGATVTTLPPGEFLPELDKYSSGTFCERKVPDGTIVQILKDGIMYFVDDNVVVEKNILKDQFIIYKVLSKKNTTDGYSVYSLEYKADLSGKCEYGNMIDCNNNDNQADICIATKCIFYYFYFIIVTDITLRYTNGHVIVMEPFDFVFGATTTIVEDLDVLYELADYSVGNYCKMYNVPDGIMIQFVIGDSFYTLADDILLDLYTVPSLGDEFLVYKVFSKENTIDGNSNYTFEYKSNMSGRCVTSGLFDCETSVTAASVCDRKKLISLELRYTSAVEGVNEAQIEYISHSPADAISELPSYSGIITGDNFDNYRAELDKYKDGSKCPPDNRVPAGKIMSFKSDTTEYLVSDDVVVAQIEGDENNYLVYTVDKKSVNVEDYSEGSLYNLVIRNDLSGECVKTENSQNLNKCNDGSVAPIYCPGPDNSKKLKSLKIVYTKSKNEETFDKVRISGIFSDNKELTISGDITIIADESTTKDILDKYFDGSYCATILPPDNTVADESIIEFEVIKENDKMRYYISDDSLLIKKDSNNYIVYTANKEKVDINDKSKGSKYVLIYEKELSGNCKDVNSKTFIGCDSESAPEFCPNDSNKLTSITIIYTKAEDNNQATFTITSTPNIIPISDSTKIHLKEEDGYDMLVSEISKYIDGSYCKANINENINGTVIPSDKIVKENIILTKSKCTHLFSGETVYVQSENIQLAVKCERENIDNHTVYTIKKDEDGKMIRDLDKSGIMKGKEYGGDETFGCQLPEKFVSMNYLTKNCNELSQNISEDYDKLNEELSESNYYFTLNEGSNDVYTFNSKTNKVENKYGLIVSFEESGIEKTEDISFRSIPFLFSLLSVIFLLI